LGRIGGREGRSPGLLCDARSDGRLDEERELGRDDGRLVGSVVRFSIRRFPSEKTLATKIIGKTKKGPQ